MMFHQPSSHPRPVFSVKELRGRPFFDRYDAGRRLGERLLATMGAQGDTIVIALPRGGVAVGDEIARMLHAPLDVITVCKLGAPGNREFAIGATAAGGAFELDAEAIDLLAISAEEVRRIKRLGMSEAHRRESHFRHDRAPLEVLGRRVILVDDGAATGATMRVAIRIVRSLHASAVTVAIPVAPPEVVAELERLADDVICLVSPVRFEAVGQWYVDFHQLTDIEVCSILDDALEERVAVIH